MKLDLSMLEPAGPSGREACGLASAGGADAVQTDGFPLPAVADVSWEWEGGVQREAGPAQRCQAGAACSGRGGARRRHAGRAGGAWQLPCSSAMGILGTVPGAVGSSWLAQACAGGRGDRCPARAGPAALPPHG